jgi:hypothetical protein
VPPTSPPWPRALAAAALLAVLLAALYALDRAAIVPSVLRTAPGPGQLACYAIVALAGLVAALVPVRPRRVVLVAASLIIAPIALGAWAAALVGYAALVLALARAPLALAARIAVAIAAWAALPIARARWADGDAQFATLVLISVWAGQLYAALYLLVERERELPARRSTALADALYLLAPPRLITPFFQPISPRQLARRARAAPTWPALARAAGLAALGLAMAVIAHRLGGWVRHGPAAWLAGPAWLVAIYARLTYPIFLAVAVFRLLGFDLPSGFHTPFLSRSFAEFFRRFNYYVRDAVLSLFYYPLLGRLRHHLPPRAATILSAYLAIVLGSFIGQDLLVPLALAAEPGPVLHAYLDPVRVAGFVALWSLTILPTAGLAPRPPAPASRARRLVQIALFNAAYLAIWYAQLVGRGGP